MPSWAEAPQLRRCALAVAVMHDIDVLPSPHGLVLPGSNDVAISWAECRRGIAGADPESPLARLRLKRWFQMRRWLADRPLEDLVERARPYGACVASPLHPGLDWVRRRVLGDTLDLGFGFVGIDPDQPDLVVPVPHQLLRAAGVEPSPWWPTAVVYLERMGEMAAERIERTPLAPLRPMGDCDVVTLLGSRTLRQAIVDGIHDGMRTVAVPMRTRGWLDLNRIDPAFSAAAARLTDVSERGFDRPLLVTREEVVLAKQDGDTIRAGLEDDLATVIDIRDVKYHRMTVEGSPS
jgi:diadenosine tetraphosphatase ApaH/serine/threonine PP2A family protein phosphatase